MLVPDDHDPKSEGHYIEIRLEFHATEDEDKTDLSLASVQIHSHHVPDSVVVDTLLITARQQIQKSMNTNMFKDDVPAEVKAFASSVLATKFLTERLNSADLMESQTVDMTVPDDASELFDE